MHKINENTFLLRCVNREVIMYDVASVLSVYNQSRARIGPCGLKAKSGNMCVDEHSPNTL